jgi:hypothetical protein
MGAPDRPHLPFVPLTSQEFGQLALGLSYRCACGKKYKIYMPKHKLFGEIVSRTVDWLAVDAREEAEGEVEDVKRASPHESLHLRGWGQHGTSDLQIDLKTHFRSHLVKI